MRHSPCPCVMVDRAFAGAKPMMQAVNAGLEPALMDAHCVERAARSVPISDGVSAAPEAAALGHDAPHTDDTRAKFLLAETQAVLSVSHTRLGIGVIAIILLVAALYLARAFFVPLLIGILASYALRPVVDWLKACRIPRPAGAALVLAALIAIFSWGAFSLGDDAASMIEGLPEAARKVRQHVIEARKAGPTALQKIQEAATELQGAAADAAEQKKPAQRPASATASRDSEPSVWLRDYMLTQSALLFT